MNIRNSLRRNWFIVWREIRFSVFVILAALMILCLISAFAEFSDRYLSEGDARRSAEEAHAALIADVLRVSQIGAPGYTKTDFTEGTDKDFELRRIK